jgi:hypothetical protein
VHPLVLPLRAHSLLNSLYVMFDLPNIYLEDDDRRIIYFCDRMVWRNELDALAFHALESRRSELLPGTEAVGIAAAKFYGY